MSGIHSETHPSPACQTGRRRSPFASTGVGSRRKSMALMAKLIVNAQGEPTDTVRLKRTHLGDTDTSMGIEPKPMDYCNRLLVNAQGEPADTVRLKRTHFGDADTSLGIEPKPMDYCNRLLVNARSDTVQTRLPQGEPADTIRLKRTHFGKRWSAPLRPFNSLGPHHIAPSEAAKRPTGAACKTNPFCEAKRAIGRPRRRAERSRSPRVPLLSLSERSVRSAPYETPQQHRKDYQCHYHI